MFDPVIGKLRYADEPGIRYKVLANVLGKDPASKEIRILRDEVRESVLAKTLLAERAAGGGIPLDPQSQWRGSHWVLAVLADLGYARGDDGLVPLRQQVYDWLFSAAREESIQGLVIDGRYRGQASEEGNALYYLLALGLHDERTDELARRLRQWQRPDGGWSCDVRPRASSSSLVETVLPLRGLALHGEVTGSPESRSAAERAADVLLERELYKRPRDGQPLKRDFTALHYPCYDHYDILFALRVMIEAGFIGDERCRDAIDLLESKRLPEGGFPAEGKHYRVGRHEAGRSSLIDWGGTNKRRANDYVTVDALQVLSAAGRLL